MAQVDLRDPSWTAPGPGTGLPLLVRRCRSAVPDPLDRFVLVALVLVSACLLSVLATVDRPSSAAGQDCVSTAVQQARSFAAVLGDDRPVPGSLRPDVARRPPRRTPGSRRDPASGRARTARS